MTASVETGAYVPCPYRVKPFGLGHSLQAGLSPRSGASVSPYLCGFRAALITSGLYSLPVSLPYPTQSPLTDLEGYRPDYRTRECQSLLTFSSETLVPPNHDVRVPCASHAP
jgi:hypothetical protein